MTVDCSIRRRSNGRFSGSHSTLVTGMSAAQGEIVGEGGYKPRTDRTGSSSSVGEWQEDKYFRAQAVNYNGIFIGLGEKKSDFLSRLLRWNDLVNKILG